MNANAIQPASETLESFLSTLPPMQAGRARKALLRQQGFSGAYAQRFVWAERHYSQCVWDKSRARLHTSLSPDGVFYEVTDVTVALCDYIEWLQANRLPI